VNTGSVTGDDGGNVVKRFGFNYFRYNRPVQQTVQSAVPLAQKVYRRARRARLAFPWARNSYRGYASEPRRL